MRDLGLKEILAISDSRCEHRVITDFKRYIRFITDFTPCCNRFFTLYPIKFTVGRSGHPKTHPFNRFRAVSDSGITDIYCIRLSLHFQIDPDPVRTREPQQVHGDGEERLHRHLQLGGRLLHQHRRHRVRIHTRGCRK